MRRSHGLRRSGLGRPPAIIPKPVASSAVVTSEVTTDIPQTSEGGLSKVQTQDYNAQELLIESLIELKKMNLYLMKMSDIEVTDNDLGG